MEQIIEVLKAFIQWYVDTGLAKDTADSCGYIVTYCANVLIPLMWEYINVIFGSGVIQ